MVTYLSPFVPFPPFFTALLCELPMKGMKFAWNKSYQETFDSINFMVYTNTILQSFNVCKPITIQVHALQKGQRWPPSHLCLQRSNTHKTVLCKHRAWNACLHLWHGKVSQYVFVCAYSVKTDHKSLEQIKLKDLSDAWICLQRKLLHLQNYDVTIKYHPGKEMLVADVLSHYSPLDAPEILLDITINQVQITPQKNAEFQAAICDDPILCSLADTIFTGWPQDINDVLHSVCPYHAHHNILTVKDDHILHVEALVILATDRVKVLQAIHEGHLSITKC